MQDNLNLGKKIINNHTSENWLSILANTGLVYLLQPYFNNIARIIKRPKIYFMDAGLAFYLAGYMDSATLEKSSYNGAIFETYVVTEIIKSFTKMKLIVKNTYIIIETIMAKK